MNCDYTSIKLIYYDDKNQKGEKKWVQKVERLSVNI
jgi:hypothetical protein